MFPEVKGDDAPDDRDTSHGCTPAQNRPAPSRAVNGYYLAKVSSDRRQRNKRYFAAIRTRRQMLRNLQAFASAQQPVPVGA